MFFRQLTTWLLVAGCFFAAWTAFASQNIAGLVAMTLFPVAVLFINRPDIWLALSIALFASGIKVPQAPLSLDAFDMIVLPLCGFAVVYRLVKRGVRRLPVGGNKFAIAFMGVVIMTMLARGTGMRIFGSSLWGGASYVALIASILLYLLADTFVLTPRLWLRAVVGMSVLSLLPFLAQVLFFASKGRIFLQFAFIQTNIATVASSLDSLETGRGIARISFTAGSYLVLAPLVLFRRPFEGKNALVTGAVLAATLVGSALSGSRNQLFSLITFVLLWAVLKSRQVRWRRAALSAVCAVAGLLLLGMFAEHLPLPVQRVISFVPTANVSNMAQTSASETLVWRMHLWRRVVRDIPDYWLIGQGYSYDPRHVDYLYSLNPHSWEIAYLTRGYHQGLLGLLVLFGIFGLLSGFGFVASVASTHFRALREPWTDQVLERIHALFFVQFLVKTLFSLLIGGNIQISLPIIFFYAAVSKCVRKTEVLSREAVPDTAT